MYVRITRGRFQPERIDDVEALSSDIAEAIKILPGFLGYQGGVDRNTSTIVAISNWEDRGSAEFPRDKLGDVLGRITALVQLEPAVEHFLEGGPGILPETPAQTLVRRQHADDAFHTRLTHGISWFRH